MAVDYENYAIVYECKDNLNGTSVHSLWVSSRSPIMSDRVKSTVDELLTQYFQTKELKYIQYDPTICDS